MSLLELNAVGVARLQVLDQHLACDLVLTALGNREVDLQERVRVAVEDRREPVLLEQLDVLEPVDVLARRRCEEVDVVEEVDVLLVRKPPSGEVLGIEPGRLLRFVDAQSGTASSTCDGRQSTGYSRCFSSIRFISASVRSSLTPGLHSGPPSGTLAIAAASTDPGQSSSVCGDGTTVF